MSAETPQQLPVAGYVEAKWILLREAEIVAVLTLVKVCMCTTEADSTLAPLALGPLASQGGRAELRAALRQSQRCDVAK